jgi:Sugar (and other) transporter
VFAAIAVISFVWISRNVPETKGRTLEEIDALWDDHDPVATHRASGEI